MFKALYKKQQQQNLFSTTTKLLKFEHCKV